MNRRTDQEIKLDILKVAENPTKISHLRDRSNTTYKRLKRRLATLLEEDLLEELEQKTIGLTPRYKQRTKYLYRTTRKGLELLYNNHG